MRIKNIHIKNFRCYEIAKLDLHPHINIVVGVNGTGKTSVLEAIRILLGGIYCEIDKVENKILMPAITEDDVRLHNLESQFDTKIDGTMDLDAHLAQSQTATWDRWLEKKGGKTKFSKPKEVKALSSRIQEIIRNGENKAIPLIAYYSTDRYKKEKKNTGLEADGSRLRGYYNALDAMSNSWFFLNIIRTETYAEIQEGKPSPILKLVYDVIRQCVPNCKELQHNIKQDRLIIKLDNGEQIPYNALSDGVRSVLSLAMELALRCYLLNPYLGENAAELTPGVVLIDEIDLHLHPEWQLHIVNDLAKVFKQIQFVMSTHAPLVVSSIKEGKIFSIADQQVYDFPNQYCQKTDQILKTMGSPLGSQDIDNVLAEYRLLIERGEGETPQAIQMRQDLENLLGKNHDELRRTDIMLRLFKAAHS